MATIETQVGLAKLYGFDKDNVDAGTVVTLTGAATITLTGAELEEAFDLLEIKGQDGNVETLLATNRRLELTIDFMPRGATRGAAATSAGNMLPAPLSKVVLSNFKATLFNGDYNYIGGATLKATNEGVVMMGLRLRAYIANRSSLTLPVITG